MPLWSQDRPYRPGMTLEEVLKILTEMILEGKLDKNVMAAVVKHADHCFALAGGGA